MSSSMSSGAASAPAPSGLLWQGRMPPFPGMGYPLVPGYESVGRVIDAGRNLGRQSASGSLCRVRAVSAGAGLVWGAPRRASSCRARARSDRRAYSARRRVLLALAATAYHATLHATSPLPDLIVGHGVLGRLLARLAMLSGDRAPVVWEDEPEREQMAATDIRCSNRPKTTAMTTVRFTMSAATRRCSTA